jgi:hypothetical protein
MLALVIVTAFAVMLEVVRVEADNAPCEIIPEAVNVPFNWLE